MQALPVDFALLFGFNFDVDPRKPFLYLDEIIAAAAGVEQSLNFRSGKTGDKPECCALNPQVAQDDRDIDPLAAGIELLFCCAGDAAVKFAVGIFMLASPLGSMAAWTVMVGLFFLFVGASVIFSAVYLDRLPHDFEDF